MSRNNNGSWDTDDIFTIVIAFAAFWPLGVFLVLKKLGVFNLFPNKKSAWDDPARMQASRIQDSRMRAAKYKTMTADRDAESIEYLASAVGISYESALREIQSLVSEGYFGDRAYINYVDKTLVLHSTSAAKSKNQAASESAMRYKSAKKAYSGISAALLIIGIIFSLIGLLGLGGIISGKLIGGVIMSVFFLLGGAASFFMRGMLKKRALRFIKYLTIIQGRDSVPISELASVLGVSEKKVREDLDIMFSKGILPNGAYTDIGLGLLIINPDARPAAKETTKPEEDTEARYNAILREIRELNDAIPGEEISARIYKIEELTSKIFKVVEEAPEKLPQIKSFMSYYLPTTLKLLRSYAEFEDSGAGGESVDNAKADIERILDTLQDGFRKQLDKLYDADAMDISSDINVLETMMKRDGLSDDESGFGQVSGGH